MAGHAEHIASHNYCVSERAANATRAAFSAPTCTYGTKGSNRPGRRSSSGPPADLALRSREHRGTAVSRMRAKSQYSSLPVYLCGASFTLPQLHAVYEAVLGESNNKVSFRRKVEELGMLESIGGSRGRAGKPAGAAVSAAQGVPSLAIAVGSWHRRSRLSAMNSGCWVSRKKSGREPQGSAPAALKPEAVLLLRQEAPPGIARTASNIAHALATTRAGSRCSRTSPSAAPAHR